MKKQLIILCAVAFLAGCSTPKGNGGPTVFLGEGAAEVNPSWMQFLATAEGQESISNQYFVSGIPRFLLIDAEGKIASVNAPRPSTPNLLDELKALL